MSDTLAPQRTRKPRGPGRLKPKHYDYLRLRQSGKTQKEAAQLANIPVETAKRAEKHPDGAKFLQDIADNARIAAQYSLEDAVREVDKAIAFNYGIENGNAIAKLLEHKSKLFGLLVEKVDIKTTYIDLKGALDQAKERVLKQLNKGDRGISSPELPSLSPTLPKGNILTPTDTPTVSAPIPTDPTASTSIDSAVSVPCLHQTSTSITDAIQADSEDSEGNQQLRETSSDKLHYVNSEKQDNEAQR